MCYVRFYFTLQRTTVYRFNANLNLTGIQHGERVPVTGFLFLRHQWYVTTGSTPMAVRPYK
jgi:hypothetical protein